ncbi:MAG TPA: bifunctional YncE family protein/alkaline phosphatase family protein [Chthoniobacterales bacterium]
MHVSTPFSLLPYLATDTSPLHIVDVMLGLNLPVSFRSVIPTLFFALLCGNASAQNVDENAASSATIVLPTGKQITPMAVPGATFQLLNPGLKDFPEFVASGAISTAVSPDQGTLLVLTSGFNLMSGLDGKRKSDDSQEYIFIYDISSAKPVQRQVLKVPNTFAGLAFDPRGKIFYVSGGKDDNVHTFAKQDDGSWSESGNPISLGHTGGIGLLRASTLVAGGLAVTGDGTKIVVANVYNDSVSVVDATRRIVSNETDLRPGKVDPSEVGVAGGEYPFWVTIKGDETAYVSSLRDREIVVLALSDKPRVRARIHVEGNPNKMVLNRDQSRLFVCCDNSDTVDVIDTKTDRIVETVRTTAPETILAGINKYRGSAPNSLVLSPDESRLYVTNGGTNSVAIIKLSPPESAVVGLLPTAFYPNSVSVSGDGDRLFVVNGKSPSGPNPKFSRKNRSANQYIEQLQQSGLQSFKLPDTTSLDQLTRTVAANNSFGISPIADDDKLFGRLRQLIKHVIYIVKENRTYDQVLGDLDRGNGDPKLTEFGEAITPNAHQLARAFVDLDNFFDSGDVSGDGWPWSTSGRESDFGVKAVPLNYSERGTNYEYEGSNRNINLSVGTTKERIALNPATPNDPDLLPGNANVAAPDGPVGTKSGRGYIWDAALRAGTTVRNYGFFVDSSYSPLERDPYKSKMRVAYVSDPELLSRTDIYFRGFDLALPDYYREREWEREFDGFVRDGNLPAFELVRFGVDHTGGFNSALDNVNTPERQVADNDYAVGLLVDKVAHSPYKNSTLICIVEDDAQNGADHVDAHRSTAYIVGPYVKHGAVISNRYTTVNMVRTLEDLVGAEHLNINTATQRPMVDVFDLNQQDWNFDAVPSVYLNDTQLPIKEQGPAGASSSTHDGSYWIQKTAGFDFTREDDLKDPEQYNRIIWEGIKGDVPYPTERSGLDLRHDRAALLR